MVFTAISRRRYGRSIKRALLAGWFIFSMPAEALESPVKLRVTAANHSHHVFATNTAPTAMSVIIELSGTNLSSDRKWPQLLVIAPGATVELGTVRGADPQSGYRFNTRLSSQVGDYTASEIAEEPCRLPYPDGAAYPMTQAFGGLLTSHSDPLMQQAIDFTMPEGTSILAARDGTVVSVEDNFTAGGTDTYYLDKANQVTVQHSDGTVAVYVHLFPHSVKVSLGQYVRAGELLAKSGTTGFSSGPHLHFALMRPKLGEDNVFRLEALPVHFVTGLPKRILVPVAGLLATATTDRPATVIYQSMPTRRAATDNALLERAALAEVLQPMQGDKPVVDTRPLPADRRAEAPQRYWFRFAVTMWFVIFIGMYWIYRGRKARQLDE